MARTQVSITAMMLLVGLLGVDFVVCRLIMGWAAGAGGQAGPKVYGILGLVPILNATIIGSYLLVQSLRAGQRTSAFTSGFVVTSLVVSLAYEVFNLLVDVPRLVFEPLLEIMPRVKQSNEAMLIPLFFMFYSIVIVIPQFLVAWGGAWLFRRLGIAFDRQVRIDIITD